MNPAGPVLGILIPCRNEERVLARRLTNLAIARWPEAPTPHRICLVDDGSTDATADRARELCAELFDQLEELRAEVVVNTIRPGKSGAITCGLKALEGVDLVVLTDADVVVHPGALIALAEAFQDASTGMVSGAQVFVRELAADGSVRGPGGGALLRAGDLFDRATAWVRALESSCGRLFSVHGQLLAWRSSLALEATPGVAADDIDLALSVRAKGARVRLAREARFFEEKPERDGGGEAQALRRARAYVQVVRRPGASIGDGLLDRLQFGFYRTVPLYSPELFGLACTALIALAWAFQGLVGLGLAAGLVALLLVARPGRDLLRLASVIRRARAEERAAPLSDSWEMERS